jgi:hypothetical protein
MGRANPSIGIPEAKGLAWDDTYFEGDDEVVAVFDLDYEKIEDFQNAVCLAVLLFPAACICSSVCCIPCTCRKNTHWSTYAQHVAVTQDGIKYVQEKHKSGCGFDFQDKGKTSKTVPFDKITDCDV